MEAVLEPGLAWTVIATEEEVMDRIEEGKLLLFLSAFDSSLLSAFAFPLFAGAILISRSFLLR